MGAPLNGWNTGCPGFRSFHAFVKEHAFCKGERAYWRVNGAHRIWCPCGARFGYSASENEITYLEAMLAVPAPLEWPFRLAYTLGRWSVRLEDMLWVPVIQAARRILAWTRLLLWATQAHNVTRDKHREVK